LLFLGLIGIVIGITDVAHAQSKTYHLHNENSSTAPVMRAARAASWASQSNLRAVFHDAAMVKRFLNDIASEGNTSVGDVVGEVYEFRIIDLDRDGWLELVALHSGIVRKSSAALSIVFPRPSRHPAEPSDTAFEGFVLTGLTGFDVGDLNSVLRDLDDDGRFEIVMPALLDLSQDATQPLVTIPEVYEWHGGDCAKVSAKHPDFYRDEVLPRLERELQKLDALAGPNVSAAPAEIRARRQKYLREIAAARSRAK
jgi:hypothetical protein